MMTTNLLSSLQSFLVLILLFINIHGVHSKFGSNGGTCRERERIALLKFKAGLIDEYGRLSSWESTNCCEWKGFVCDNRTNHVVVLDLHGDLDDGGYPNAPLRGKISPSLLQLSHLYYLDLSLNDFNGTTIPNFIGLLSKLQHLNLSMSDFGGPIPHHIGNLSALRVLDLRGNWPLTGINLDWLSGLPSLEYLDLSIANLRRCTTWLQAIHKLTALKQLHLFYCQLPTVVPISFPSLNYSNSLVVLDLSSNYHLSYSADLISWFLNTSTSYKYIEFSGNDLDGRIPDTLGNLMSLSYLGLGSSDLNGSYNIAQLLGNLTSLSNLDLSYNQLHGEFSRWLTWFRDPTRLKYLDFSGSQFYGPFPNMSRFTVLKELYLYENLLNGAVSQGNLRLPNLEILGLSGNRFTGILPNLSSCPTLRVLLLYGNTFNGSLVESISHLSKIEILGVGYNKLEGVITEAHLSSLPHLSILDLSFNFNITLRISSSWIHPVQFRKLHLAYCTLGPYFPKWLQTQNHLDFLDISSSGIFDTIPGWFWGIIPYCSYLNMSYNQIYGVLPDLSSVFKELSTIDLSSNGFTGSLPPLPPLVYHIDLSRNEFSGPILSYCNFKDLFLSLDISNNLLSGEIPHVCFMNLLSIAYLDLANNSFFGDLPTTNNLACRVTSLHLRNNSFIGEIPRSLMNCSRLTVLDLGDNEFSGEIPEWLGESVPLLGVLILKSNMLLGSLPSSLCHLSNLQVLDISLNKITGTIPNCINKFTLLCSEIYSDSWDRLFYSYTNDSTSFYDSASVIWKGREETYVKTLGLLKVIDLSSNELTGEIPHELTSLIGLLGLNLSRNNLVGVIPHDIDKLKMLNFLDLSRNNLSGGIPVTLSKLSHLGVLDLSFNNFSGRIPWDTHLQTFGASTYSGNSRLCGPPLLWSPCPEDESPKQRTNETGDSEEEKYITRGFYISMVVGFIAAFWVVFWTLFISKWWNAITMKIYITVGDWLYVKILVNKRRLLRCFGNA